MALNFAIMGQDMIDAATQNEIDRLYDILSHNPTVLETIDQQPFVETPLHLAAFLGQTHFAIEVLSLKPSFGKKLDFNGFSPLQLAVRSGRKETAVRLVEHDSELLRVQGNMRSTPLHEYVARLEGYDADVLALFLLRCPKCIDDLNIRRESAVHVALKSGNVDAFELLLGWLQRTGNLHVLDLEDENGDTALHVAAAATAQNLQVVKLLSQIVQINKKNQRGLTALSIALANIRNLARDDIVRILRSAGAEDNPEAPPTLSERLAYEEPNFIWRLVRSVVRPRKPEWKSLGSVSVSAETRSTLLVVAVLVVTATYQAVLSPPGGLTSGADRAGETGIHDHYGKVQMGLIPFFVLLFLNSVPFLASIAMIIILLPKNKYWLFFVFPLLSLSLSYCISAAVICPQYTKSSRALRAGLVTSCTVGASLYIGSLVIYVLRVYL